MVGDIVILPFPYTDTQNSKDRPTVVLADVSDGQFADWIVCPITTSKGSHRRAIPIIAADLLVGSLYPDSKARPDRLATFAESRFGRTVGRLTDDKLAEILAAVRSLF